jgi:hypothetical protein
VKSMFCRATLKLGDGVQITGNTAERVSGFHYALRTQSALTRVRALLVIHAVVVLQHYVLRMSSALARNCALLVMHAKVVLRHRNRLPESP